MTDELERGIYAASGWRDAIRAKISRCISSFYAEAIGASLKIALWLGSSSPHLNYESIG